VHEWGLSVYGCGNVCKLRGSPHIEGFRCGESENRVVSLYVPIVVPIVFICTNLYAYI
jgi:hypothetical protein